MFHFAPFGTTLQSRYVDHVLNDPFLGYRRDSLGEGYYSPIPRSGCIPSHYRQQACAQQFEDIFYDRRIPTLPLSQSTYVGIPSSSYCTPASLRALEEEELRRSVLIARQHYVERARASALAREREEYVRRVRARRQAEELSSLVNFLTSFVEQPHEVSPVDTAKHPSSSKVPAHASFFDTVNVGSQMSSTPFNVSPPTHPSNTTSIDRKGKARETPAIPLPKFTQNSPEARPSPSLVSELLKERNATETDSEVKNALEALLNVLSTSVPVQVKKASSHSSETTQTPVAGLSTSANNEAAPAKRNPAISPATRERILNVVRSRRARKASLATIQEIENSLRSLESTFVFPSQLDFSRPSSPRSGSDSDSGSLLAYTSNNRSVHAYEHALSTLLEKLDAVESGGDLEVRGRRKEVVGEVEKALREVERRVEESRERASPVETAVKDVSQDNHLIGVASVVTQESAGITSPTGFESETRPSVYVPTTTGQFSVELNQQEGVENFEDHQVSSTEDVTPPQSNPVEVSDSNPELVLGSVEPNTPSSALDTEGLSNPANEESTPTLDEPVVTQTPSSPVSSLEDVSNALPEPLPNQTHTNDIKRPLEDESTNPTTPSPTLSSDVAPPFLLQTSPIADAEPLKSLNTSDDVSFEEDTEIVDAPKVELTQAEGERSDIRVDVRERDEWSEVDDLF